MQLEPLTPNLQRLHMTVSKQFLDKLEAARKGQGHAQPGASAEKVIEVALDLLLAQQAKRRGEVKRPQQNPRPARTPGHVPAAVRREVWSRDDGRCTWPLDSGGTCGSTLRLEIDHVVPRGRGGPSTVENCRLTCAMHNQLAARQVYGNDWMDQFTTSEAGMVPVAREPEAAAWGSVRLDGVPGAENFDALPVPDEQRPGFTDAVLSQRGAEMRLCLLRAPGPHVKPVLVPVGGEDALEEVLAWRRRWRDRCLQGRPSCARASSVCLRPGCLSLSVTSPGDIG